MMSTNSSAFSLALYLSGLHRGRLLSTAICLLQETQREPLRHHLCHIATVVNALGGKRKKTSYSEVFFIIWHRAIFPGVNPKYCNRCEA